MSGPKRGCSLKNAVNGGRAFGSLRKLQGMEWDDKTAMDAAKSLDVNPLFITKFMFAAKDMYEMTSIPDLVDFSRKGPHLSHDASVRNMIPQPASPRSPVTPVYPKVRRIRPTIVRSPVSPKVRRIRPTIVRSPVRRSLSSSDSGSETEVSDEEYELGTETDESGIVWGSDSEDSDEEFLDQHDYAKNVIREMISNNRVINEKIERGLLNDAKYYGLTPHEAKKWVLSILEEVQRERVLKGPLKHAEQEQMAIEKRKGRKRKTGGAQVSLLSGSSDLPVLHGSWKPPKGSLKAKVSPLGGSSDLPVLPGYWKKPSRKSPKIPGTVTWHNEDWCRNKEHKIKRSKIPREVDGEKLQIMVCTECGMEWGKKHFKRGWKPYNPNPVNKPGHFVF
jgi:hypothetical protein